MICTNLKNIRIELRKLLGTAAIPLSDYELDSLINEYYRNIFPHKVNCSEFKGNFTQQTSATDSGEYSISEEYLDLKNPFTLDGEEIQIYTNKDRFFDQYPDDSEQYITSPTLAIGTSSKTSIANSAFTYMVSTENFRYQKAAAETILSGDTIPQSKYGTFSLKIDEDGTITVAEADDNDTGYSSAAEAVDALDAEDSESCFMGYVTVINTSGTFVPGTTELDATGVTATYTNGLISTRNKPEAMLYAENKIFVRPKANDIYLLQSSALIRPAELTADTSVLTNTQWGFAIALGTAITYLTMNGGIQKATELSVLFADQINNINNKTFVQVSQAGIERNW
jgi:hypothetical protein